MVVSDLPLSFSAMAPPARRECTPIRSGSMPFLCRPSVLTALRMVPIMASGVTAFKILLFANKHKRESVVPPCLST
eukprot:6836380-Ditylum_brightwellii.AAC.1